MILDKELFNSKRTLLPPHLRTFFFFIGKKVGYFTYKISHYVGEHIWAQSVIYRNKEDNLWKKLSASKK